MLFSQLYTQSGNTALVNDVTLAKQAVNDAINELVAECLLNFTESALQNLTGGTYQYNVATLLGSSPLRIHYIKYYPAGANPITSVLTAASVEDVIELQNNTGIVGGQGVFAMPDFNTLYLYPTPATGDQIRLYYSAVPTALVNDNDTPTVIPSEYHYIIPWVAARNLAVITSPSVVGEFEPLAQAAIAKLRTFKNIYGGRRPQVARVGLPTTRVIHDRSQYYTGLG